jgi:hypothetical protein
MTSEEALELIRALLKAPDTKELNRLIAYNLPRMDGVFFSTLNHAVLQLRHENKPQIADALEKLGGTILKMRTII